MRGNFALLMNQVIILWRELAYTAWGRLHPLKYLQLILAQMQKTVHFQIKPHSLLISYSWQVHVRSNGVLLCWNVLQLRATFLQDLVSCPKKILAIKKQIGSHVWPILEPRFFRKDKSLRDEHLSLHSHQPAIDLSEQMQGSQPPF